ncbi:coiled-coil and C2 domain-containing protein 1-like isoform X2 [Anthonomus grandis grandis]|uniref:coiled-coil and C2 domain-containing protein 1-like isoform X2 n=1 Tax=Anthonomus grandis grandis TaxID=2921223 RepID=UPI002166B831|nr:coiled-coil and C2 domain-containing protein 1-like isoform X2 [Anthonomus grandis grandis]
MFSRKKPEKPKRDHSGNLAQFGLMDIPSNFDPTNPMGGTMDSDGGDSDLEAELAALAGTGGGRAKPKKAIKKPLAPHELDALVSGTLKDIQDVGEDEEDIDENDPDLLSELQDIAGDDDSPSTESPPVKSLSKDEPPSSDVINTLMNRIKNYQMAESEANSAGETSKAKRYGRAIKTLNDLIKKAKNGGIIDLNDDTIPPEIKLKAKPPVSDEAPLVPSRPAPALPPEPKLPDVVQGNVAEVKKQVDEELLGVLLGRQKEYKMAALQSKKAGDNETALGYLKIAKVFDQVIEAVKSGQSVDLSDMPGPPSEAGALLSKLQQNERQGSTNVEPPAPATVAPEPEPQLLTAGSVNEALQQRLEFYKTHEQKAKEEDNSSKARRFGRIVKQYEQAIKSHKAGRAVAFDELPTPPGFGPIPGAQPAPAPAPPKPSPPSQDTPKAPPSRMSGNKVSTSHQEKQVLILQAKQKQFKAAALNAKKQGELVQAKEFLKQAKGFDKLIEAAEAGLPVDWSSIPVSPDAKSQLDYEYDIVMADECTDQDDSDSDMLSRLETQLTKQLKMCLSTRDHHKALGDVAGTNRFERLALNVTKDLDVVRVAKRMGSKVPKFHYETKEFAIVKSFTELTDNDLELLIVRGINYRSDNPKDIDTYVKFEFPFPTETPYSDRTSTVRDTNNPDYNQTFNIPIQRNSRQCQRVFKRHGIKFEVYSKGGFFRSDSLIGTVNLKLQRLETHCEIHDSFDLMDGRRKTGGKLELRLRLRSPIVTQQVEQVQEKWLIIDQ